MIRERIARFKDEIREMQDELRRQLRRQRERKRVAANSGGITRSKSRAEGEGRPER